MTKRRVLSDLLEIGRDKITRLVESRKVKSFLCLVLREKKVLQITNWRYAIANNNEHALVFISQVERE